MAKICFIVVSLVPEADKESNKKLEHEIQEEATIPWCRQIENVTIRKLKKPIKT